MRIPAANRFTVFALVDALTSLTRDIPYAGDRAATDARVSGLLRLVARARLPADALTSVTWPPPDHMRQRGGRP